MIPRSVSKRARLGLLVAAALGCGTSSPPAQELIAHPGTDVHVLTRNEARLYFTMRLKQWPDGTLAKVFVLPDNHPVHRRFANEVLGLYPYQLRRVWDRQIFTGTGQGPITVSDEQEMVERVARTPGALGYVDELAEDASLQVFEVR